MASLGCPSTDVTTCSVCTPFRSSHMAGLFESTVPDSVNSGAATSVAVGWEPAATETP
jgi:hypothetical protein